MSDYKTSQSHLPIVALVGRTNVGKSTLFNRLTSTQTAITSKLAGTTRDSQMISVEWRGSRFNLVDTGGLEFNPTDDIEKQVKQKALQNIKNANLVVLLIDAQTGIISQDKALANLLRRWGKSIILVINKADNPANWPNLLAENSELGIEPVITLSSINGSGTGDLLDTIHQQLPADLTSTAESSSPQLIISIIGQPNVGKSALINSILGTDQQIVSAIPHTTRDAQLITLTNIDPPITLIDTAGIRRRIKKGDQLEKFSIKRARNSLKQSNFTWFVIDVSQPPTWQDKHLAQEIISSQNSLIIVANKWDLISEKTSRSNSLYDQYLYKFFPHLIWAPIIYLSAKKKLHTDRLLPLTLQIYKQRRQTISENTLDKFLKKMIKTHPPTKGKGQNLPRLSRLRQVDTNPPTFAINLGPKQSLAQTYLKFLEKNLRDKFSFTGTPVKLYISK